MFKYLRISLFLLCLGVVTQALVACLVKEAPSIDALACTKDGKCAEGYRCYVVSGQGQGILCLKDGEGFQLYEPITDAGSTEKPVDTLKEPVQEAKPEARPEPGPEPGPEPTSDEGSEPGPEPKPEPTSDAASDAGSGMHDGAGQDRTTD